VRDLCSGDKLNHVNFTLHKGEVLGIAGMIGSGRTELLRAIFGADKYDSGQIVLDGKEIGPSSLRRKKDLGLAFIPENRKEQSLVLPLSIRTNLCLASLKSIGWHGFLDRRQEKAVADQYIPRLAIKVANTALPVSSLSGGNQQKVVVGKWLNTHPRVVLFDEPTRGIDLQAKQHIFQIMWELSQEGISSIVVSSELEELVEVCHRILIMKAGRIVEEVLPETISVEDLVVRCMSETAEESLARA
jgi:ABC-type sugar transport system ATPase subunit